jgi:malate/lactate dehydrogenase
VRASKFVSEVKNIDPKDVNVHVIGGHSGVTIMPLLSQTGLKFTQTEIEQLTKRIQFGGDEVVKVLSTNNWLKTVRAQQHYQWHKQAPVSPHHFFAL